MSPRSFPASLLLPLALALAAACRAAPLQSGPPTTNGSWAVEPALGASAAAGRRYHVTCEDPVRSSVGERITSAFTEALTAKGYTRVESPAEADFLCGLVVRYLGHSVPPDGHADVLLRAGDTILGGDEGWLAADGSGFDTQTRRARGLRSRPRVRGFWGELFRGHEDDEWTLLIDLAIGTRTPEDRQVVQRHEGRLWASAMSAVLERAAATELLLAEVGKLLPQSLP